MTSSSGMQAHAEVPMEVDDVMEASTRRPAFIGWQCDVCFRSATQSDLKLTYDYKTHCFNCYNEMLESLNEERLRPRQFRRLSKQQHLAIVTGPPWSA